MNAVCVEPVDPRDQRWEIAEPKYRVYFWSRPEQGCTSREFELTGGDVLDIVRWADRNARQGETYVLYAVAENAGELGLIRLSGRCPSK